MNDWIEMRPTFAGWCLTVGLVASVGALAACTPASTTTSPSTPAGATAADSTSARSTTSAAQSEPIEATPPPPPSSTSKDAANSSPPEPHTPPDLASPQAAATTVETYFALVDAGKVADADALWGDATRAAEFRTALDKLGKPHVQVFAPGGVDGAAGSMYVTVPVEFAATDNATNSRPRKGEATLRRVNDVPGSTEAQRRWHIDHIDVAMTPK